ncbi:hypothetical protein, partial [Pseudomonas reactans]
APATKHQKRLLERVAFFVRVSFVGLDRVNFTTGCGAARRGASPLTTKTFSNLKLRLPEQLFDRYIY